LVDYIKGLKDKPLILNHDGQLIAVLMPIRDAALETVSLSLNPNFIAMLQESRARLKTEGGISLEQLQQELSEFVSG
jgi:pyridoxine 5'-phosphate synthase PdxJ